MRLLLTALLSFTLCLGTAKAEQAELTNDQLASLFSTSANSNSTVQVNNQQLSLLAQQLQLGSQAKGEFQQTRYLAALKRPLKSTGEFIFSQDIGLLWKQTTPFASALVLKQNTLIQQDSFGNITHSQANQTSSAMAEQLPQLMQALLTGDLDALAQDFELFMPENIATSSDSAQIINWQLGLVAKDPLIQKAIGAMVLEGGAVDTKQQINRLTMLSTLPNKTSIVTDTGDRTIINFFNVVQKLTPADIQSFELSATKESESKEQVTRSNNSDSETN
ncbi:outer membrane lipoprotein carrier protein LolA [Shewanella goraebulensis]|uniref:outer membrane lipoprotein carrier protein LolA n=1 Tax=Shewanella goraebulensis TaxID=3050637 RepID=UPI00254B9A32|nr:outer membrane lipoprotein carrier protein LolA [Shewanella goraebulensis]